MADWMRVIDTVSGLAQTAGKFRPKSDPGQAVSPPAEGQPGGLEARLAGVVVAALKEAFDRDRARMDLERAQADAERQHAEAALAAELRRQGAERGLSQLRLVAVMAIAAWMLSAALAVWLPGMHGTARALLGTGWALAFVTLGCAFAGSQQISAWTVGTAAGSSGSPESAAATAAPWALLAALAATGAAILAAL